MYARYHAGRRSLILLGTAQHAAITRQLDYYVSLVHSRILICTTFTRTTALLVSISRVLHCLFSSCRRMLPQAGKSCHSMQTSSAYSMPTAIQLHVILKQLHLHSMYLKPAILDLTMKCLPEQTGSDVTEACTHMPQWCQHIKRSEFPAFGSKLQVRTWVHSATS
jgi:hypothetical protein